MDLNLTGYFWGMPVDFSGDIAANSAAVAVATPWMAFFSQILTVIVGGVIVSRKMA
ncbi:MAG: hypothetical protein PHQ39_14090 [Methanothrix soehngenii]|jgi:hypothetical protein|nr:hypothetical protein [Methanothrix soehngenii]NLI08243.1 hypothetical protein [Thermotogaceae bacterium]